MPTEMEPVVKTEELVQKSERQLELEERISLLSINTSTAYFLLITHF